MMATQVLHKLKIVEVNTLSLINVRVCFNLILCWRFLTVLLLFSNIYDSILFDYTVKQKSTKIMLQI